MKLKNLYIYSDKEKDAVYFVSNLLIKDVMKLMTHFRSACCINYKPPGRNASSSFGHDPQSDDMPVPVLVMFQWPSKRR